jgi:predicted acetyltransferase
VTADEDNVASRRVIESNGGELENIVMGKVYPNPIARYWVECTQG